MSYIERKVADFDPKEAASLLLNIGTAQIIFSTFRKARLEVVTCIAIGMLVELLSKTKTSGVQLSKVIVLEPDTYVVNPRLMIGVSHKGWDFFHSFNEGATLKLNKKFKIEIIIINNGLYVSLH